MIKRALDIVMASVGLLLLSPLFLLVAIFIKLDSSGPIFFRQERMGKGFRPFFICKFRTMLQDASRMGRAITSSTDSRITRVGRILRKTKVDEFPQLINVLRGEMSLVGPRPEVREYVELFRQDYEEIVKVAPGITDLASIQYRYEAEILAQSGNPEKEYIEHILPEKIILAKEYIRRSSLFFDITLILKTMPKLFRSNVNRVNGVEKLDKHGNNDSRKDAKAAKFGEDIITADSRRLTQMKSGKEQSAKR